MFSGRLLEDVLRTSLGRRLEDVMKKGRRDFHFRPVEDVFETKIKTFLRRLCDVFVSAGALISRSKGNQIMKFGQVTAYITRVIFFFKNHAESEAGRLVPDHFLLFEKALY